MNKEEWKDYYGYNVSNCGRVINRFGREIYGQAHNFKGYSYWEFFLRINGKRINIPANTLVYQLFGKGFYKGIRIYHKDGNPRNNRIDNLYACKAYTKERTKEQIEIYNQQATACVKWLIKHCGYLRMQKYGYDIDNVIGESLLLIWKYLPCYENIKFLTFCKKYVRFAFLEEWKYHKHNLRLEEVY